MSSKLTLSKIKGKPTSSVPLMSFRFLQDEDDLEEVSPEEQENEKEDETLVSFRSSNTYPTLHNENINISAEESSIPHSLSTDSNEIFSFSDTSSLQDKTNKGIPIRGIEEKSDVKYSASFPSEPSKLYSETVHKETRDSSPMKESVKDYLAKLGKKSSSLENSPATENDNWSLFNELKGRITKTFEEKISRESNYSFKCTEKLSSRKTMELSSPVETPCNGKDALLEISDKSVSSPCSTSSEKRFVSTESIESDTKSISSEEQLPLSLESFGDHTEDSVDVSKCIITTNTNQKKSVSAITASAQALLSPKRTRSDMSVKLSTLISTKGLDSDSIEETHSETDIPNSENAEQIKTDTSTVQKDDTLEDCNISLSDNNCEDNFLKKFCNKYTLPNELYMAYVNMSTSWQKQITSIVIILIGCVLAPIPPFLSGLIIGILFSAIVGSVLWWMIRPVVPRETLLMPDYVNLPKLTIPSSSVKSAEDIYKGWMNELPFDYNPDTYHVSNTQSVYVRLDGTSLRLSHPKNNIPKRAMWNETRHDPVFIHQRYFDIAGATISLLPDGLAKKRLWSKKYPICLEIPNSPNQFIDSNRSSKETSPRNSINSMTSLESLDISSNKTDVKSCTSSTATLYLFARTSREKEEWYWLLYSATKHKTNWLKSSVSGSSQTSSNDHKRALSIDLGAVRTSSPTNLPINESLTETSTTPKLEFGQYMLPFLDKDRWSATFVSFAPVAHSKERKSISTDTKSGIGSPSSTTTSTETKETMLWLNALIGRIFYNFLTEHDWSFAVADRIQKKLDKIKVPYFIQELKLTDINLGKAIPQIQRTSDPVMDERGLWIDFDITYNGSFQMTLETKLNLLRLKRSQGVEMDEMAAIVPDKYIDKKSVRSSIINSEEEDSAESSSDEEICPSETSEHGNIITPSMSQHISSGAGGSTSKKLLRLVDKIAQSRYFQQATENRYIKRAMEEVSNTPLFLTVEVHALIGTLAVNIPPVPTDRLWYGFRNNPQLSISARPKLGEREVTLAPVTDWIEKKLVLEFQKILVMPNMDDLIIPIMNATDTSCS